MLLRPLPLVLALLVAGPALADPIAAGDPLPERLQPASLPTAPEAAQADPVLAAQPVLPSPAESLLESPKPKREGRIHSDREGCARARLDGLRWIGLFADVGDSFRIPGRGVGTDARGGAYLSLLENLALEGSYRMLDYDVSHSNSQIDAELHGAFFGLSLNF